MTSPQTIQLKSSPSISFPPVQLPGSQAAPKAQQGPPLPDDFFAADEAPYLAMAGMGGGTLRPPSAYRCLIGLYYVGMSFRDQLRLVKTMADMRNHGFDSMEVSKGFDEIIKAETGITIITFLSHFFVGDALDAPGINLQGSSLPKRFLKNNYALWTPFGLGQMTMATWEDCGSPGSGLGKKIGQRLGQLTRPLSPTPAPASSRALTFPLLHSENTAPATLAFHPESVGLNSESAGQIGFWGVLFFCLGVFGKNALRMGTGPASFIILPQGNDGA